MGLDEAKQVYGMFARHRSEISAYEKTYGIDFDGKLGSRLSSGKTPLTLSGASAIHSALKAAYDTIFADIVTRHPQEMSGISAGNFLTVDLLIDTGDSGTLPAANLLDATEYNADGSERKARNLIVGDKGFNIILKGGAGDDVIIAGAGNDYLDGGADKDRLYGNAGNDTLDGLDGQGGDYLAGGLGNDIYYADNGDIIYDEDGIGTIYVGQSKTRLTGGERKADEAFFTSADKSQVYQENPGGSIDVWTSEGHITIQPSPGNPGPRAQPTSDGSPGVQSGQPGLGSPLISPKPKDPPPADPFNGAKGAVCPLILDLDGNGVQVTTLADGVYFDHDGNGFVESTAWVGGNDGLLVWDKNHDGKITTGNELFGDRTLLKNGRWGQNGFDVLVEYDDNHDGKIDANDALWSSLQLWVDDNHNGISSAGELHSLADYGIQSFDTAYAVEYETCSVVQFRLIGIDLGAAALKVGVTGSRYEGRWRNIMSCAAPWRNFEAKEDSRWPQRAI